jgi:putative hemolysin
LQDTTATSSERLLSYSSAEDPPIKKWVIRTLEERTGQPILEKKYRDLKANPPPADQFWTRIMVELEIGLDVDAPSISRIPSTGPVIFVANHPFGIADGAALCYLASLIRPKFSVLANSLVCNEELVAPYVLPIDFEQTKEAIKTNIESKNEALKRLAKGEALLIFPGGGVSTSKGFFGEVTDLEWKRFVIKMVVQSGATVVPIFFEGQNSKLFQFVSQFSLNLRYGLFIRETMRLAGKKLKVHIGSPIPAEEIIIKPSRQEALDWLRAQVYALKQ